MGDIAYDDFAKLDLRVGAVAAAARVEGSGKLLTLTIDLGGESRTLVAGIGDAYAPEALIGRRIVVLANLQPKTIRGIQSQGMLLAADADGKAFILTVDECVPAGARVR